MAGNYIKENVEIGRAYTAEKEINMEKAVTDMPENKGGVEKCAGKLLLKIEEGIDGASAHDIIADKQMLKQITGALRDIRDIQQSDTDGADRSRIKIEFVGSAEEYSK